MLNTILSRSLSVFSLIAGFYAAASAAALPSASLGAILCAVAALGFLSVTAYFVYVETSKPE